MSLLPSSPSAPSVGAVRRTMMAARVDRFGPPDVIAIERIEVPSPGDDEILVRVCAAGVRPIEGGVDG